MEYGPGKEQSQDPELLKSKIIGYSVHVNKVELRDCSGSRGGS